MLLYFTISNKSSLGEQIGLLSKTLKNKLLPPNGVGKQKGNYSLTNFV